MLWSLDLGYLILLRRRNSKMQKRIASLLYLCFLIISCNKDTQHLVDNIGKTIFYEIEFQDKDKNKEIYRQSYHFLPIQKKFVPVIKNNGEMILYLQKNNGISRTTIKAKQPVNFENFARNHDLKRVIAFPVSIGTEWETEDITTIQLKMGFDRIYNTDLPVKLKNKIVSTNETILVNGRKIKDCVEISSYGETSFNPGPPLDVINIEIVSKTWYSKELGVVRYEREEKSDSATTGNIYYNKTLLVD